MPTRLRTRVAGTPTVTPSTWTFATQINPVSFPATSGVINDGSTMTSKTEIISTTNPHLDALGRLVWGPLAAQTISGTIKGQMRGSESNTGNNATLALAAKIIQPNGTDRGVLLAATASDATTAGNELTTTLTNMSFRDAAESASLSLTSQTAQRGDYLVIEWGVRTAQTTASRTVTLSYGNDNATDLPEDTSTTAANNPWWEFSGTVTLIDEQGSVSGTLADATVSSTASRSEERHLGFAFTSQTSVSIPGTMHGLGTAALLVGVWDASTPAILIEPALVTVHPSTLDVVVTFGQATSGTLILGSAVMETASTIHKGQDFTAQTSVTVLGTAHGFGTTKLLVAVYDSATPAVRLRPSRVTVDPTSFDVVVTFGQATSGRVIVAAYANTSSTPYAILPFSAATSVTFPGSAHQSGTKDLLVQVYDGTTPAILVDPGRLTVHPSTFDVVATFSQALTGTLVVGGSTIGTTGTVALTLASAGLASTGAVALLGTAGPLATVALTLVATSVLPVLATATPTLVAFPMSGAATLTLAGTASPTLGMATSVAAGVHTPLAGDAAMTGDAVTSVATGALALQATSGLNLDTFQASSTSALGLQGSLSGTTTVALVATSGAGMVGQVALTLAAATSVGTAGLAVQATGGGTLESALAAGTSGLALQATSTHTLGALTPTATSALALIGTSTRTLTALTLAATSVLPGQGQASLSVAALTLTAQIQSSATSPNLGFAFTNQTTVTITGVTHGLSTANLLVQVWDAQTPSQVLLPGSVTVHPTTFDVTVTFLEAQSGLVVLNSATVPLGTLGNLRVPFTGQTVISLPGSAHQLGTRNLLVAVYDAAVPAQILTPGSVTVDPTTFDVVVTLLDAQDGSVVLCGGGSGLPQNPSFAFTNQTTVTVLGTTHGMGTAALLVQLADTSVPARRLTPATLTVHPTTFDVVATFAEAQSGTVIVNGSLHQTIAPAVSRNQGFAFSNVLSVTAPGTLHGIGHANLLAQVYDAAVPAQILTPGSLTVHPTTFDVTATFLEPQSGLLVVNGACAPTGAQGNLRITFTAQTLIVIAGTTHGYATANLLVVVYDASTPAQPILPSTVTVDPVTFDVTVRFLDPQSGALVLCAASAGTATPNQSYAFTAQTSLTVPGPTHGLGTAALALQLYDASVPAQQVQAGSLTVDPTTFDVVATFATPESGRLVLNGSLFSVTPPVQGAASGFAFTNVLSVTIPGVTHQLGTADLLVEVHNAAIPNQLIVPDSITIDPSSFNVVATFSQLTSGTLLLLGAQASAVHPHVGVPFTNQTTVTVLGTAHALGTPNLFVRVYDASIPAVALLPQTITVHPTTFDVVVTFSQATSGRLVVAGYAGLGPPPILAQAFTNQTTVTITGVTHGLGTPNLLVQVWDTSTPRRLVEPSRVTVHPTTYDVTVTFSQPLSGRLLLQGTSTLGITGTAGLATLLALSATGVVTLGATGTLALTSLGMASASTLVLQASTLLTVGAQTLTATGTSAFSGQSALTLAALTLGASGVSLTGGSTLLTTAAVTSSAQSVLLLQGTALVGIAAVGATSTATVTLTGQASGTTVLTLAANGVSLTGGTALLALEAVTSASQATLSVQGTGLPTLAAVMATSVSSLPVTATSATIVAMALTANGVTLQGGTALLVLDSITTTTQSILTLSGASLLSLGAMTQVSTSVLTLSGQSTPTLATLALAASGVSLTGGTALLTLASAASTSQATLSVQATGLPTVAGVAVTSVSTLPLSATTPLTLTPLTVLANGVTLQGGTALLTLAGVAPTSQATLSLTGTSLLSLGTVTATGTSALPLTGQSTRTLATLALAANGVSLTGGTVLLSTAPVTSSAQATLSLSGSASVSLTALADVSVSTVALSATAARTLTAFTLLANGVTLQGGTSLLQLQGCQTLSTATLGLAGTGTALTTAATLSSLATVALTGTSALPVAGVSATSVSQLMVGATVGLSLASCTLTATAAGGLSGTAVLPLTAMQAVGSGVLSLRGTATLLSGVLLTSTGVIPQTGASSLNLANCTMQSDAVTVAGGTLLQTLAGFQVFAGSRLAVLGASDVLTSVLSSADGVLSLTGAATLLTTMTLSSHSGSVVLGTGGLSLASVTLAATIVPPIFADMPLTLTDATCYSSAYVLTPLREVQYLEETHIVNPAGETVRVIHKRRVTRFFGYPLPFGRRTPR